MELNKIVSKKITECRKLHGWKQYELAKKIGVTGAAMCQYEKGLRLPGLLVSLKLARVLDVSIDYLVGLEEIGDTVD